MKNLWRYLLAIIAIALGVYLVLVVAATVLKIVFAVVAIAFVVLILKTTSKSSPAGQKGDF